MRPPPRRRPSGRRRGDLLLPLAVLAGLMGAGVYKLAHRPEPVMVGGARLHVIDGDTIALGPEHIRLIGLDAPERAEPRCAAERVAAEAARQRLRQLLVGDVGIARDGRDQYGRTLATVTVGGRDVAERMIAEGHALAYRRGETRDDRGRYWCSRASPSTPSSDLPGLFRQGHMASA